MSNFTVFARLPSPLQIPNYVIILEEATTHAFSMQVAEWFLAESHDRRPANLTDGWPKNASAVAVWAAKQQSKREELMVPKKVRAAAREAAHCKRVKL